MQRSKKHPKTSTDLKKTRAEFKGHLLCLVLLYMSTAARIVGNDKMPELKADFETAVDGFLDGMEKQIEFRDDSSPEYIDRCFREGILYAKHQILLGFDGGIRVE